MINTNESCHKGTNWFGKHKEDTPTNIQGRNKK